MKNTVSLLLGLSLLTFVIGCVPEPPKAPAEKPAANAPAAPTGPVAPAGTTAK